MGWSRRDLLQYGSLWGACALAGGRLGDLIGDMTRYALATPEQQQASDAEFAGLQDDPASNTTVGFRTIKEDNRDLYVIRRGIGQIEYPHSPGIITRGSVVLIDEQTVVMCAHEVENYKGNGEIDLYFSQSDTTFVKTRLSEIVFDHDHDLAFATIVDSEFSRNNALFPVAMGDLGYEPMPSQEKIICVGFPASDRRLHATVGNAAIFYEFHTLNNGQIYTCKAASDAIAHPGMSGGAVLRFYPNAGLRLAGIINTVKEHYPRLHIPGMGFTPANLIRQSYCELYPDRARAVGIEAPPPSPAKPSACDIGRRNFFTFRPTQG